jgi:CO/xanthine dehydrogenase Mo-binding subunit
MKTVVINNPNVSQTGCGELGITLSASAIGNAIFDAIGVRVRQLPFTPANVLAAIADQKQKK